MLKLERQHKKRQQAYSEKRCMNCYKVNNRYPLTICADCQEKKRVYGKAYIRRLKHEVFAHYGGAFCNCCLEPELDFLSLDHLNGDGYLETVSGYRLYVKLKKQNYPPGFKVSCHNCNLGRHINGGVCPHETSNSTRNSGLLRMPDEKSISGEYICQAGSWT